MGCAGYKKIQQRRHHREYYCLLGAKRGLRNVSQRGSFLQISTLLHGASPCWASQCLWWCRGCHGMWRKTHIPRAWAVSHCGHTRSPSVPAEHPTACHTLDPKAHSSLIHLRSRQSHAEQIPWMLEGFFPPRHQLCEGYCI